MVRWGEFGLDNYEESLANAIKAIGLVSKEIEQIKGDIGKINQDEENLIKGHKNEIINRKYKNSFEVDNNKIIEFMDSYIKEVNEVHKNLLDNFQSIRDINNQFKNLAEK